MIFLDANILLELTLPGRQYVDQVGEAIINLETKDNVTSISMLTAHLIMYFGRKENVSDDLLTAVIEQNNIAALKQSDYEWAKKNEISNDFEDALQVAVALRTGCAYFVTLDKRLAKRYTDLPIQFVVPKT